MSNVIAFFIAAVITLPLLGWYIAYIITVKITKRKSYSVKLASDLSAIIFILAVYFIMAEIWNQSLLWLIFIIILSVAIIFTFIHWKVAGDIHIWKLFRGIWRFNFLLFFILYIALSIYGLILRIIA